MKPDDGRTGAYLSLVGMMTFWGLSFVATKLALETFPPFTLIFARFALASCFFLLLMNSRGFPVLSKKEHLKIFLVAFFEPGLYFIFETIGLQYTTAPKASLIIAAVPVVVVFGAFLFLRERTSLSSLLGIGISLLGIFILVTGDSKFDWALGGALKGDLLILGAVISAAMYTISARSAARTSGAFQITGLQMLYGAILYFPGLLWEWPGLEWRMISARSAGALVYLTLFSTIAAFLCYNYALTRITASKAAVFINGIPVVTALGAWIVLDEYLSLMQMGGGILVLLGVFMTNRLKRSKRPS